MSEQFNLPLGKALRELGKLRAKTKGGRIELLLKVQAVARDIAKAIGFVTADEVWSKCEELGIPYSDLGNAAGSIFKGKEWEFTGQWHQSRRAEHHARMQRIWRLKNGRA